MATRIKYKTQQREELLSYLKTVAGSHITAAQVCEYFHEQGKPIGTATVYRHLERMVDEGLVNKYSIDSNSPACFEYIADPSLCGCETCFHCKCESCGKLIHLHCEELNALAEHLNREHQFVMDPRRTVFYGLCEKCASVEASREPGESSFRAKQGSGYTEASRRYKGE